MNHIQKRIALAGAGRGDKKPKPPTYKPPIMGQLLYGASYSFAETIDLISDGPIAGLVNKRGELVGGASIFQGIYLDDTPIAVTSDKNTEQEMTSDDILFVESSQIAEMNSLLPAGDKADSGTRKCRHFFQALNRERAGLLTAKKPQRHNNGQGRTGNEVVFGDGAATIAYSRIRFNARGQDAKSNPGVDPVVKGEDRTITMRARITDTTAAASHAVYQFWFDGRFKNWGPDGPSSIGTPPNSSNEVLFVQNRAYQRCDSLYWTDGGGSRDLNRTKFICGFGENRGKVEGNSGPGAVGFDAQGIFQGVNVGGVNYEGYYAEAMAYPELQEILKLYNDNIEGVEGANPYQLQLAKKALQTLDSTWTTGNPISKLIAKRINGNTENEKKKGIYVLIKVERDQPTLNFSMRANSGDLTAYEMRMRGELNNNPNPDNYAYQDALVNAGIQVTDVTCPTVDSDGKLTGECYGFMLFRMDYSWAWRTFGHGWGSTAAVKGVHIRLLSTMSNMVWIPEGAAAALSGNPLIEDLKFNYSNVLAEFQAGAEIQKPLSYFSKIFIDKIYNIDLYGPFRTKDSPRGAASGAINTPQRLAFRENMMKRSEAAKINSTGAFNTEVRRGLPLYEGSDDERQVPQGEEGEERARNFSTWGDGSLANWNEAAISSTHTILNPNVKSVFITLSVLSLKDTAQKEQKVVNDNKEETLEIGSSFAAPLNIRVEVGTVGTNGINIPAYERNYRIIALIESETLIDIGNPDSTHIDSAKRFVIDLADDSGAALRRPFELPAVPKVSLDVEANADGGSTLLNTFVAEDSPTKRYVKVTKLSYETNSVLLHKDVSLNKVTEIIPVKLNYPFSAMVGTKLDSRSFGTLPKRTFDCKLKLVKVPSNYDPVGGGRYSTGNDKRYFDNAPLQRGETLDNRLVYDGDWDGYFNPELQWTDNPAWILYDLLTNKRYGLGNHINEGDINKWELYKIGRFCDAVDEDGYFVGVADGRGGLEPRFSCNIVFNKGEKIYDAIATIAEIFRGKVFFGNSQINFVDDRPRSTVNLFTNENVKDGVFHYSNNRRDEQFNTIEVAYLDRFDNFNPKLEVVEDEEDISQRGIFKKRVESLGVTSRAMARRVGQHLIFSKIKENQQVAFNAGLESLLCQPGDLVIIEDDLKTNKANFGKILSVDTSAETIRVSNSFVASTMTGRLTVYQPTGIDTISDMDKLGDLNRERYSSFIVGETGTTGTAFNAYYTGQYGFSGYTAGYTGPDASGTDPSLFVEYAAYTGTGTGGPAPTTTIYFHTGVTGWVFATGDGLNAQSGQFISSGTGTQLLSQITGYVNTFDMTVADRRGSTNLDASGLFSGFSGSTYGVMDSEIQITSPSQTNVLNVTGTITSTSDVLGTLLSGVDKPALLPFLKLGSPSKFEIKDASPFIYKINSIKEENPNEYLVTASKYDTGKFALIEDDISIENKSDTFSYKVGTTVNGITYTNLTAPAISGLTTGSGTVADTFYISGNWADPNGGNSTGYNAILTYPNYTTTGVNISDTGVKFDNVNSVGPFTFSVNALGNKGGEAEVNAYFDSDYASSGIFVLYEEMLDWSRTFLSGVRILRNIGNHESPN